jgi:hypothetical protein
VETPGKGRLQHLLAAAIVLGLAGLTKYNGGYLGVAVAAAVILRPRLRHLLLSWEIYAAAVIAILFQIPVLLFALSNDFASFRFHLSGRFGHGFEGLDFERMGAFILETLALASPFLVWASFRYFRLPGRSPVEDAGRVPALAVFLLSTGTFLYISNFSTPNWWWNIAAFALGLPFLGRYMGRVMLSLHAVWGALISTVLVVTFSILPLSVLIGARPFLESARSFGWPQIVEAVTEAEVEYHADFLAANRYQLASQLGFALDRGDIEALSDRRDAFDDWLDADARRSKDAIILVERVDDTRTFQKAFEVVTKLGEIEIVQFGYKMKTYELYFGDNFIPPLPPD